MKSHQSGFSPIELAASLALIGVLVFVGVYVYNRQQPQTPNVQTKNAYIGLFSQKDDTQRSTYLRIDFIDSAVQAGCSSSAVKGFVGNVNLSYTDKANATLAITQNKRPPAKPASLNSQICIGTEEARSSPDIMKKISINQQWLDNDQPAKTIKINGRPWKVTVKESTYSLEFRGSQGQYSLQPYLPVDVVEFTVAHDCMSDNGLLKYINDHQVQLAEHKYPGIDAKYLKLNQYYNRANRDALVISNNYVRSLMKSNASTKCNDVRVDTDPGGNGTGAVVVPLYK